MPKGITMLGRGIMILQSVLAVLSPDINIVSIAANHLPDDVLGAIDWENKLN